MQISPYNSSKSLPPVGPAWVAGWVLHPPGLSVCGGGACWCSSGERGTKLGRTSAAGTEGRQSLRGTRICKATGPKQGQRTSPLMTINLIAQGICPWLGAGGLHKLCRAEPWAAGSFAGATAPPAYLPVHKQLSWLRKATLLITKNQKFLNVVQVISHIRKNQQRCGLSPPLFLLDLRTPMGMQLSHVRHHTDQNDVKGLQSPVLQEEKGIVITGGPASSRARDLDRLEHCVCAHWAQGSVTTSAWCMPTSQGLVWPGAASPAVS